MSETIPDELPSSLKASLTSGDVTLRLIRRVDADAERGLVSYYHFRIMAHGDLDIGHINFRVGDTAHVTLYAGHIGFEIKECFRGHGYALQACRAMASFVRSIYKSVIITCDPDNHASRLTIERLGARFINEIAVSENDPQHARGSRIKRRYEWEP